MAWSSLACPPVAASSRLPSRLLFEGVGISDKVCWKEELQAPIVGTDNQADLIGVVAPVGVLFGVLDELAPVIVLDIC